MSREAAQVLDRLALRISVDQPANQLPRARQLLVLRQGVVMTEAERIARAIHTITIQQGNGQWNLNEIRHILEGKS